LTVVNDGDGRETTLLSNAMLSDKDGGELARYGLHADSSSFASRYLEREARPK
jgi:hypothetical protein